MIQPHINRIQEPASSQIIVVGAGFTGLSAAYELCRRGHRVTVIEQDNNVGGLAGSFPVEGQALEKFYHHWFTNDRSIMELVHDLGLEDQILSRPTQTGMYYANSIFRLCKPMDVLRFTPLSWWGRFRLGLLVLLARWVKDWRQLESLTAEQWLLQLCGEEVYRVVWEPLLRGKFGTYASQVSAVWFWNKLILRGGSRQKGGAETLCYMRGGFAALADRLAAEIRTDGGQILTGTTVESLIMENGRATGVKTLQHGEIRGAAVLFTPALPLLADLVENHAPAEYVQSLRKVQYLANVCLVLELDRSLSDTYWLNVNDPNFPYVAVIEHTNFEPPSTYDGRHIVYLSKYLTEDADLFRMNTDQVFEFSLPHIQRMFPHFRRDWVLRYHVWRAKHSQPVVVRHYSQLIPDVETPIPGLYLCTMAQTYPEDRGTNYAVRDGRKVGRLISEALASHGKL